MKMIEKAAALFEVPVDEKRIASILWHLGLRETCTRCGGCGSHSYNQRDGSRCWGCDGQGKRAAKLSKNVLETARAKVDAGELVALRARWKAVADAKRQIAPRVAAAEAIYRTIADAYDEAYKHCDTSKPYAGPVSVVHADLFLAMGMNNSIFWGPDDSYAHETSVKAIERAVHAGNMDSITALARIDECISMLETLRDAWLRYSA